MAATPIQATDARIQETRSRVAPQNLEAIAAVFFRGIPRPVILTQDICFRAVLCSLNRGELRLSEEHISLARKILSHSNQTLYQVACINGLVESAAQLLESNRSLLHTLYSQHPRTGLYFAAFGGQLQLVQFLLDEGHEDNINRPMPNGRTALHGAIDGGHPEVVEELVTRGAGLHIDGEHPEVTRVCSRIRASLHITVDHRGFSIGVIPYCVAIGAISCFDVIIQVRNVDWVREVVDGIGNLLHVAIWYKQHAMLRHLLHHHREEILPLIDAHQQNGNIGFTPLALAASLGDCKALSMLLLAGASIRKRDRDGNTALLVATRANTREAIQLLAHGVGQLHPALIAEPQLIGVPPRNLNFLDRPTIMRRLELERGSLILSGREQSGKTEMAKEFIYRNGDRFSKILWIDESDLLCSLRRTLRNGFQRGVENTAGEEQLITALREELENFDNPKPVLIVAEDNNGSRYWEGLDRVRVLVLESEYTGDRGFVSCTEFLPVECEAAQREFFHDRYHFSGSIACLSFASNLLREPAHYTIDQVCKLLAQSGDSLTALLGHLLKDLCNCDPHLEAVLQLIRFFDRRSFPVEWLRIWLRETQEIVDPHLANYILKEVLGTLQRFQIIVHGDNEDTFSVTKYVWGYLRDQFTDSEPSAPQSAGQLLLNPSILGQYDPMDFRTWDKGDTWVQHARSVLETTARGGIELDTRLEIIHHLNTIFLAREDYSATVHYFNGITPHLSLVEQRFCVTTLVDWYTHCQHLLISIDRASECITEITTHSEGAEEESSHLNHASVRAFDICTRIMSELERIHEEHQEWYTHISDTAAPLVQHDNPTDFFRRSFSEFMRLMFASLLEKLDPLRLNASQGARLADYMDVITNAFEQCSQWIQEHKNTVVSGGLSFEQLCGLQREIVRNSLELSLVQRETGWAETPFLPYPPFVFSVTHPLCDVKRLCIEEVVAFRRFIRNPLRGFVFDWDSGARLLLQQLNPFFELVNALQHPLQEAIRILTEEEGMATQPLLATIHFNLGMQNIQIYNFLSSYTETRLTPCLIRVTCSLPPECRRRFLDQSVQELETALRLSSEFTYGGLTLFIFQLCVSLGYAYIQSGEEFFSSNNFIRVAPCYEIAERYFRTAEEIINQEVQYIDQSTFTTQLHQSSHYVPIPSDLHTFVRVRTTEVREQIRSIRSVRRRLRKRIRVAKIQSLAVRAIKKCSVM